MRTLAVIKKKGKWIINPEWVKAGPESNVRFCFNPKALKEFTRNNPILIFKRKSSK